MPSKFRSKILALTRETQLQLFSVLFDHPSSERQPGQNCCLLGYAPLMAHGKQERNNLPSRLQILLVWRLVVFQGAALENDIFITKLEELPLFVWDQVEQEMRKYLPEKELLVLGDLPFLPEKAENLFSLFDENPLTYFVLIPLTLQQNPKKLFSEKEVFVALQGLPVGTIFRLAIYCLTDLLYESSYQIDAIQETQRFLLRSATYSCFTMPGIRDLQLPSVLVKQGILALPGGKIIKKIPDKEEQSIDEPLAFLVPRLPEEKG